MADEADLDRLKSGVTDLAKCDLRGTDLSGLDLSNRDFSGCLLDKIVAHRTDFSGSNFFGATMLGFQATGANFSNANMRSKRLGGANFEGSIFVDSNFQSVGLLKCDFRHTDLRGANFSNARFLEDNKFEGAESDESTLFDGARILRALARLPVFRHYYFRAGTLIRLESDHQIESPPQKAQDVPNEKITLESDTNDKNKRIELTSKSVALSLQAKAISAAINEQINSLNSKKPNDEAQLARHVEYVGFLANVAIQLNDISSTLETIHAESTDEKKDDVASQALREIKQLNQEINSWWDLNRAKVVNWGFSIGLLGAGQAFLVACGAPANTAFLVNALIFGGYSIKGIAENK